MLNFIATLLSLERYQINARTELAVRYNDISPLENHHCAVAFQILSNPETNIFANVDTATFKRIRSVSPTISAIFSMAAAPALVNSGIQLFYIPYMQ